MLGWILINFILGRIIGLMWIRSIKKSTPESIIGGFPTNRKPPLSLTKQGLKLVKIKMGKKFGLTHTVIGGQENVNDMIRDIVGTQGADVVIETTGNSRVIEQAYKLTHPDGKTICVGVPNKGEGDEDCF